MGPVAKRSGHPLDASDAIILFVGENEDAACVAPIE